MELITVVAICLIAAFMCLVLYSYKPEYSMAVAIAAGCFIFFLIIKNVIPAIKNFESILSKANISSDYFKIAFKALGICYVTQFAADVCRDFGQSSLASKAILAGKCAIFLLSVPLLRNIIEIAVNLIGGV